MLHKCYLSDCKSCNFPSDTEIHHNLKHQGHYSHCQWADVLGRALEARLPSQSYISSAVLKGTRAYKKYFFFCNDKETRCSPQLLSYLTDIFTIFFLNALSSCYFQTK